MSQLRITKQSSDVRQGIAVRTVGTFLIGCLVMAGCVIPITAQDRGNPPPKNTVTPFTGF